MKHRAFLKRDHGMFLIFIPSIMTYTEARTENIVEAREMAKSALEDWRDAHGYLPDMMSIEDCYKVAQKEADDEYNFLYAALMQIEVD